MVGKHHFFQCDICKEGENPRCYGKGEFRIMWVELPEDHRGNTPSPKRLNLCYRHYEILAKLAEWDRWDAFRQLCDEEQEGGEQEYVHPVDESEFYDD